MRQTPDACYKITMKTVLITGCSSGFGKMTVSLLLKRGHTVIAAVRGGQERLDKIFGDELKTHSASLLPLDLHMEKPETFGQAAQLVNERFGGKLDALINNAGYGLFGSIEDVSEEQLRHQLEVNFFGPALLTRALLPALRAARGRVINLSSVAGRFAFPTYAAYNASKFALEGLSEAMHYDLKPHGVQVALIEPGGFKTDFSKRSRVFGAQAFSPSSAYRVRNEKMDRFLSASSDRLGDPMRVARLIARYVEKKHLPLRRPIGADSWLMTVLGWLVPQRPRLAMVDRTIRLGVFRD
jgi:NAD(P)-dependent dehydrogenase (short-subunit alcohol dehydrogenase family)